MKFSFTSQTRTNATLASVVYEISEFWRRRILQQQFQMSGKAVL